MALAHPYCARVARGDAAPIATKFARARKDPIGALIAGMAEAGLRFRWCGATLRSHGLERLSDRDRALFHLHEDAVLARLREPGGNGAALLDQLEVWIEMVATREDAVRIIAELPASCGLDVETAPKPEYRVPSALAGHHQKGRARQAPAPELRTRRRSIRTRPGSA